MEQEHTQQTEVKHHRYGPSSLKLRGVCPGWHNDNSGDSQAADEGTLLHAAAETGNIEGLDQDQTELVMQCIELVDAESIGFPQKHTEVQLSILNGYTFGTADVLLVSADGTAAKLIDFKFGFVPVDHAQFNVQGWAYVLGALEMFPTVQTVEVIFISPRLAKTHRHKFNRMTDRPFLEAAIRAIIAKADCHTDADLYPTEEGCQYCGVRGTCPAITSKAMVIAKRYAPLEIVDEVHSSQIVDPTYMAKMYAMATVMEKWADSVKKHAKEMVMSGQPIPGYVLRERRGVRKIVDPLAAYQAALEINPEIEPESILALSTIPVAGLEKLISDGLEKSDRSETIARFNQLLSDKEAVEEGSAIVYIQRSK